MLVSCALVVVKPRRLRGMTQALLTLVMSEMKGPEHSAQAAPGAEFREARRRPVISRTKFAA